MSGDQFIAKYIDYVFAVFMTGGALLAVSAGIVSLALALYFVVWLIRGDK